MKQKHLALAILLIICGCKSPSKTESATDQAINTDIANKFIDAFYSFNRDTLVSLLSYAIESKPSILYYQRWAECGNYEIMQKNAFIERLNREIKRRLKWFSFFQALEGATAFFGLWFYHHNTHALT